MEKIKIEWVEVEKLVDQLCTFQYRFHISNFLHNIAKPILIFVKRKPQNFKSPSCPRSLLDAIVLGHTFTVWTQTHKKNIPTYFYEVWWFQDKSFAVNSMQGNDLSVDIASSLWHPHTQDAIQRYGVKGTKVDQSYFNAPVKWIKAWVSEPCLRKGVHRGDSLLGGILQIRTCSSG